MTRIECSNCSDIVDLEMTGSLPLPFVCQDCVSAAEFQDAMTPAVTELKNPSEVQRALSTLRDWAHEPSHEATIENTTLLIADLEAQVAYGKKELALANYTIADMSDLMKAKNVLILKMMEAI